jgi:hypothetical protein
MGDAELFEVECGTDIHARQVVKEEHDNDTENLWCEILSRSNGSYVVLVYDPADID